MKNKVKIGKFINRALALRNVSQKEIADVLGVAPNIISYFCHDKRIPNTQQIMDIAEYLNVSTDYLLGRTEISSEISSDTENMRIACDVTGLSEKIIKLLHEYNEVEKSGKFTMVSYDRNGNVRKSSYLLKNFNKVIEENERLAEMLKDIIISLSSLEISSRDSAEFFINKIESGEKIEFFRDMEHIDFFSAFDFPPVEKGDLKEAFDSIIKYFYNSQYEEIHNLISRKRMKNFKIVEIDKNDPEFLKIKQMFKK